MHLKLFLNIEISTVSPSCQPVLMFLGLFQKLSADLVCSVVLSFVIKQHFMQLISLSLFEVRLGSISLQILATLKTSPTSEMIMLSVKDKGCTV